MNEGSGPADPLSGPRQQERQGWIVVHNLLRERAQLVAAAKFVGLRRLFSKGTPELRPDDAGWNVDDSG